MATRVIVVVERNAQSTSYLDRTLASVFFAQLSFNDICDWHTNQYVPQNVLDIRHQRIN